MSFLGWVDHDPDHEESVLRALGAAKGHDARDELGLGTIRDTFADLFFPGLSTIQQRVRYFLFVTWCCDLAGRRGDEQQILDRLWNNEVALIRALSPLGEREGVIGLYSQDRLERMPSEIYWNGLLILGMRLTPGSRRRWARGVVAAREQERQSPAGEEGESGGPSRGFDHTPPAPPGFPSISGLNFALDGDEAEFLRDRLSHSCVNRDRIGQEHNLFGTFTAYRRATRAENIWDHPRMPRLRRSTRDLVRLAAAFARVLHGATILYNVRVAELKVEDGGDFRVRDEHVSAFDSWQTDLEASDVTTLLGHIGEIAPLGAITRHRIDPRLMDFVARWTGLCRTPDSLLNSRAARDLVSRREMFLKAGAGTSRILFRKARDRWQGDSGGMLDYRWPVARRCLNDLAGAL